MRVKRYLVNSLHDAVPLIRTELGKDAIILESKEVKTGGFLGLFRNTKLEVLAAVEPNNNKNNEQSKSLNDPEVEKVLEQIIKVSQKNKSSSTQAVVEQSINEAPNQIRATNSTNTFASRLYGATSQQVASQQQEVNDSRDQMSQSVVHVDNIPNTVEAKRFTETEKFIVDEIKSLRKEMQNLTKMAVNKHDVSSSIEALKARLVEQELDEHRIQIIYEDLIEQEQQQGSELDALHVWEYAQSKIMEWLEPYKNGAISNTTRIIQFVGPTGVGKTTTIAKLAANYSISKGKKVGLITADTYRIAAVEQLRTYANILNLPLEVVFSPLELDRALQSLEHTELVLMDTAGRNYKSDLHVSEVHSMLPQLPNSESILVLSVTSRTSDMKIIAEKFSKYGVHSVVFTKLDESNSYGVIFNMVLQFGLTPLFITSGQNVPDDIAAFDLGKYIDLLLGEPYYA